MADYEYPLRLRFIGDESSNGYGINMCDVLKGQHTDIHAERHTDENGVEYYHIRTGNYTWTVPAEYFTPMKPNLKYALKCIRVGTKP